MSAAGGGGGRGGAHGHVVRSRVKAARNLNLGAFCVKERTLGHQNKNIEWFSEKDNKSLLVC